MRWTVAVGMIAGLVPGLALAGPAAAKATCDSVLISSHPDYPPYHWAVGDDLVGASIEVTGRILDKIRRPWTARPVGPWQRVLFAAKTGEIDLVVSLKRNEEREVFLQFTDHPFFENPMAVFQSRSRRFAYADWRDLIGRIGSVTLGDRYGDEFDKFAKENLTLTPSSDLAANFRVLIAGHADFVLTGLYTGRAQLVALELENKVQPIQPPINKGVVHHGFSRASPCAALASDMGVHLAEGLKDGSTAKAMERALDRWRQNRPASLPQP